MEDWEAYEETHHDHFSKKELVSNTFLFYGYRFHDNLIKTILSTLRGFVGDSCNVHFRSNSKGLKKNLSMNCMI